MSRIFVIPAPIDPKKPKDGVLSVPSIDHARQPLPAEGDWVEASDYWTRRINEGAVTVDDKRKLPAPENLGDAPATATTKIKE